MDDESRDVSLKLSRILEKVGVSERMRQLRREVCIRQEIQSTITSKMTNRPISVYIFGSSIEGTTTYGMNSDHDSVHCEELYPVIDHIDQTPTDRDAFLSVRDEQTQPGYVKLQVVNKNKIPLTVHNCTSKDPKLGYDNMGRFCFKHHSDLFWGINSERNGPADTILFQGHVETDHVYAVRSRTFPRAAEESLQDCTRSGWLTRNELEEMIHCGCLYVGVGHPPSDEKEFEWRISFSFQERKLMFKLNPTQHQCYVLLKFIKNILTSEPDIGKSITSYHCKTCLFRVINKTRADQWRPENLISCTFECLNELLQCVRNGDCPNFFIKTNNMFERRVYGEVRERLIHHLSGMINEGYALFYRVRSDNIGEMLRARGIWLVARDNWLIDLVMEVNLCKEAFDTYRNACLGLGAFIPEIGKYMKRFTKEDTRLYLEQQLYYLSSVNTITEHTEDETKAAIRELDPHLHRFNAANLAALAFSTDIYESKERLLQASARHLRHAMTYDLMSGRLLYASILYRQGNMAACRDLLERLEHSLNETVMTMCGCYEHGSRSSYKMSPRLALDPQSMMTSSVALCTVFLPSNTEIIPKALQYEPYRSVATPPGCQREFSDGWQDLAVVDSKMYLCFLQYLVYSRLNKPAARRLATDNLLKQLQQDRNLGHRETGYNLLGWIYSQEGQIEAAARCFLQSWRIRPHHNAAKWHMLNLIYQQFIARQ